MYYVGDDYLTASLGPQVHLSIACCVHRATVLLSACSEAWADHGTGCGGGQWVWSTRTRNDCSCCQATLPQGNHCSRPLRLEGGSINTTGNPQSVRQGWVHCMITNVCSIMYMWCVDVDYKLLHVMGGLWSTVYSVERPLSTGLSYQMLRVL